jgi:glyoxylase-like metal-dependent hydrolase (beta-lactamase superfamily II)
VIDAGASRMTVIAAPGPRPDHLAFLIDTPGDGHGDDRRVVLTGDLDGTRGARSLPGPADDAAWAASIERIRAEAPEARWLGGHPAGVRPDRPAVPRPDSAGS